MPNTFSGLKKYISDCADFVNTVLGEILHKDSSPDDISELNEGMRYAVMNGGKRFRPFLLIATADIFNVPRKISGKYAAAIELIHAYSLVHDDLPALDNDDMRRGKPSCHKQFGEGKAILIGDALLSKAFSLISQPTNEIPSDLQLLAVHKIAAATSDLGLVGGQFMDLKFRNYDPDFNEVIRMNTMKTGALFAICCDLAATIGGISSKSKHHRINMYAKSIGAAFQIVDDIYDYENDKDNKSNVVNVVGIEKARLEAETLINQAIDMLSVFEDNKAQVLTEFAKYIHSRIL